jgi:hypothetical protein
MFDTLWAFPYNPPSFWGSIEFKREMITLPRADWVVGLSMGKILIDMFYAALLARWLRR